MKKLSLKTKNILFASVITIVVALIITTINYFMSMNATVNRLTTVSQETVAAWSEDINSKNVETIMATKDDKLQKEMIAHFDRLSEYQPQVAQGYLFGTELVDGAGTSVISGPQSLMDDFAKGDLHVGDIYTQPKVIANAITEMLATKKQTISEIYSDDFGTYLTVLKPLINSNGEIFAYYGVDFDAGSYLNGEYKKIKTTILILIVLLAIVCAIQYLFMTKLFKPIGHMQESMKAITAGDYSVRLKEGDDELGQLSHEFNTLTKTIGGMLDSIKETSIETSLRANELSRETDEVEQGLQQITTNVQQMSLRMNDQTESTSEVLVSVQELSKTVDSITNNVMNVSELSITTEEHAKSGTDSIEHLKNQMLKLSNSSQKSEKNISSLKQRSDEINSIVQLITDIADQTNLLSLNAAIEAARAGEHGKGFAVVADEVRKLAEQSSKSANQIRGLIQDVQHETDKAVQSFRTEATLVNESTLLVDDMGSTFRDILSQTANVSSSVQEVSAALEEIAAENEEIASIFEQLSDTSTENNDALEKITTNIEGQQNSFENIVNSTKQMNDIVSELEQLVSEVKD
ncbi:methyl-accepting chemotaxis protein [Kurthia sibirica]|uniref:Methyl-accepting chemotaxis protein n=1 Tax=Kurthia sibirica TaxID=202750 RepID=A0A2U3AI92_9BACL|nr:methyl-accepting chemotaxis protein [Kurthia sibirica]PWI24227.1 hypothetical protein DEX24_14515 [Kurthia sibirica]GEK34125.1 methyl-accepting chemotaxis protein [Kurthia sibirica]